MCSMYTRMRLLSILFLLFWDWFELRSLFDVRTVECNTIWVGRTRRIPYAVPPVVSSSVLLCSPYPSRCRVYSSVQCFFPVGREKTVVQVPSRRRPIIRRLQSQNWEFPPKHICSNARHDFVMVTSSVGLTYVHYGYTSSSSSTSCRASCY